MCAELDAWTDARKGVRALLSKADCHSFMHDLCMVLKVLCTRGPV
jgi:hypothetical protein